MLAVVCQLGYDVSYRQVFQVFSILYNSTEKKRYGEDYILGYEVGNWESYILDCDIDYRAGYWGVIDRCENRDKLFRVSIDTILIFIAWSSII